MKLKSTELILLFLYLNDKSPIVGHTKLQKLVFLFEKEIKKKYGFDKLMENNLFNFEAYHYGPYSNRLVKDLDFLNSYSFIEIENFNLDIDTDNYEDEEEKYKNYFIYKITKLGEEYVEKKVLNKLNSLQIEALEKLKKGIQNIKLDDLLLYVYRNYPEMAKNSKIKDQYV